MPAGFLARQLEWREALEDAEDGASVAALARGVASTREALLADVERLLDDQHDPAAAAAQVRALMFVERFVDDVERRLAALEG